MEKEKERIEVTETEHGYVCARLVRSRYDPVRVLNDYSPLVLGRMLLPQTIQVTFAGKKLLPDSKQVTGSAYVCTEILLSCLNVEIRHNNT